MNCPHIPITRIMAQSVYTWASGPWPRLIQGWNISSGPNWTNGMGRRGCNKITHTLTDSSEINIDFVKWIHTDIAGINECSMRFRIAHLLINGLQWCIGTFMSVKWQFWVIESSHSKYKYPFLASQSEHTSQFRVEMETPCCHWMQNETGSFSVPCKIKHVTVFQLSLGHSFLIHKIHPQSIYQSHSASFFQI